MLTALYLRMMNWFQAEEGQDVVEYGLIIVIISLVALVGAAALTGGLNTLWGTIGDALTAVAVGPF